MFLSTAALCALTTAADASIRDASVKDRHLNSIEYTEDSFIHSNRWEVSAAAALRNAKKNYQLHCATCHGASGDGMGELADLLGDGIKPRDHTDSKVMSQRSDEDIRKVIADGGESLGFNSAMPPFSTILSEEEILELVQYIRSLCKCKGKGS